jgi:hypothetical protein
MVPATSSARAVDDGEDGDGTTPYACADSKKLIRAQFVHLNQKNSRIHSYTKTQKPLYF